MSCLDPKKDHVTPSRLGIFRSCAEGHPKTIFLYS